MKELQSSRMHEGKGFIAALDQSGGSTPKAFLKSVIRSFKKSSYINVSLNL